MAKKSANRKGVINLWPGPFTALHAVVALSIMLNVALVVTLIALARTDIFDRQIATRGAEILCSEDYRSQAATQNDRALLDYTCDTTKSHPFFLKGYNDYRKSINLAPVTD